MSELEDQTKEKENKVNHESGEELPIIDINKLGDEKKAVDPVIVNLKINGKRTDMEVDTGATYTCMSGKKYEDIGGGELGPPECMLKTYTGEIVRPKGTGIVNVEYRTQKYGIQKLRLKVTVVDAEVPTLLGREWLRYLKLDWHQLFPV